MRSLQEIIRDNHNAEDINFKSVAEVKTKDEARQIAIDWQSYQSNLAMSYYDICWCVKYFTALGKKFCIIKEFKENGII